MTVTQIARSSSAGEDSRLAQSIDAIRAAHPGMSADHLLSPGLMATGVVLVAGLVAALVVNPHETIVFVLSVLMLVYLSALLFRVSLVQRSQHRRPMITISDAQARGIEDSEIPIYSVLVPIYHEAETIPQLMASLTAIEYPRDRLDVKVLVEADDDETRAAVLRSAPPSWIEVVVVPVAEPRTKPKALNFGLASVRGEFVTIYDAEDVPDPLQLRRAVVAFRGLGDRIACLQARLSFFNSDQNLLTKFFTLDYALWFDLLLPGLVGGHAPIPLGGTSNHFRRTDLDEVGGWDPFNVTEDADLGIRLQRLRRRIAVLDSTTYEEATSDGINWVKQRSRWYKGYLQTWLVHIRNPIKLWRDLGTRGFLGCNLFVLGTPLLAAINPLMWGMALLWLAAKPAWIPPLFPAPLFHLALAIFVLGNVVCIYQNVLAARVTNNAHLLWVALITPLYWLLMALAALKAMLQLAVAPSFWEKTTHGMASNGARVVDIRDPEEPTVRIVSEVS